MDLPDNEQILASAVAFLASGDELEKRAAALLLASSLRVNETGGHWYSGDELSLGLHIHLAGSRGVYEIMLNEKNPVNEAVKRAISAILPENTYISSFTTGVELVNVNADWREAYLEILIYEGVNNQAVDITGRVWNNLRFRSQTEIQIAEALDRRKVLFLPNCKVRLTTEEGRRNRESDFLICHEGNWGILEVDGEPFHPLGRAAEDHKRDYSFKAHGIKLIEHFDAVECYNKPDDVVKRFLTLLEKNK